jgi:hypothetical protein
MVQKGFFLPLRVADAGRASDNRGARVCGTVGLIHIRMRKCGLMLMLMRQGAHKWGRRMGISSTGGTPLVLRWNTERHHRTVLRGDGVIRECVVRRRGERERADRCWRSGLHNLRRSMARARARRDDTARRGDPSGCRARRCDRHRGCCRSLRPDRGAFVVLVLRLLFPRVTRRLGRGLGEHRVVALGWLRVPWTIGMAGLRGVLRSRCSVLGIIGQTDPAIAALLEELLDRRVVESGPTVLDGGGVRVAISTCRG